MAHTSFEVERAYSGSSIARILREPRLVQALLAEIFESDQKVRLHVADIGQSSDGKQTIITLVGWFNAGIRGSDFTDRFGIRIFYSQRDLAAAGRPRSDYGDDAIDKSSISSWFINDLSKRLVRRGYRVNNDFGGCESGQISFIRGQKNPKGGTPIGIAVSVAWGGWFHNSGYPEPAV